MQQHTATDRWREMQEARGLPPEILKRAPESPWKHDPEAFRAPATPFDTPSRDAALALLAEPARPGRELTVLDVGCGGGSSWCHGDGAEQRHRIVDPAKRECSGQSERWPLSETRHRGAPGAPRCFLMAMCALFAGTRSIGASVFAVRECHGRYNHANCQTHIRAGHAVAWSGYMECSCCHIAHAFSTGITLRQGTRCDHIASNRATCENECRNVA